MKNKSVLIIPGHMPSVADGYADAFKHLGWTTFVHDPKCKLQFVKFLEEHDIAFIMTTTKFGIKQLPIEEINDRGIHVIVYTLPYNSRGVGFCGEYRRTLDGEMDLIDQIDNKTLHTSIPDMSYFDLLDGVDIKHIPFAGNIFKAKPSDFTVSCDVAYVDTFVNKQKRLRGFFAKVIERLKFIQADVRIWSDIKIDALSFTNNGMLDDQGMLPNIYAGAMVCPNIHHEDEIGLCLNEQYYQIGICGGLQVVDNAVAECAFVGEKLSKFIRSVTTVIEDEFRREPQEIHDQISHFANNHTYLDRLAQMFQSIDSDYAVEIDFQAGEVAKKHCWEMQDIVGGTDVLEPGAIPN